MKLFLTTAVILVRPVKLTYFTMSINKYIIALQTKKGVVEIDMQKSCVEKMETMTYPYSFKAKHVELTVFISNSPCSSSDHNCAKKLRDFVMTCKNVSLIVYVTHLYKVFRESCEEHKWHMIDDDFYVNTCGLWNLVHQERCEVKPYNRTVWNELLSTDFCISSEVKEKLLNDYDKKRDYYDRNGVRICNNDRSREEEDGLIGKDLKAIGGYRRPSRFKDTLCFLS